jgi:hypothetical protein
MALDVGWAADGFDVMLMHMCDFHRVAARRGLCTVVGYYLMCSATDQVLDARLDTPHPVGERRGSGRQSDLSCHGAASKQRRRT